MTNVFSKKSQKTPAQENVLTEQRKKIMSNDRKRDELQAFFDEQKATAPGLAEGYDEMHRNFRIGVMRKHARFNTCMSQAELAEKLKTNMSAISRLET